MSSFSQQSATSKMSRTKMEIPSTYLRIQFIIMTLAAKYVHVIEAPQPAQIRPNVTSSLNFPARSSYLRPRENVVQHAVSSCLYPRENISGKLISSPQEKYFSTCGKFILAPLRKCYPTFSFEDNEKEGAQCDRVRLWSCPNSLPGQVLALCSVVVETLENKTFFYHRAFPYSSVVQIYFRLAKSL